MPKTAKGAADYFPFRVLYFAHTRQTRADSPKFPACRWEKGKKKANAFGLAWPPFGVFGPFTATLTKPCRESQAIMLFQSRIP